MIERGLPAHLEGLAVAEGAGASPRGVEVPEARIIDRARLDPASAHESDRHAVVRIAAKKVVRAVDGIDHPQRIALASAALFADARVTGKRCADGVLDEVLRRAVGDADVVLNALRFHLE